MTPIVTNTTKMTYTNKIEFKDGGRHQSDYQMRDYEVSDSEFQSWCDEYRGLFKSIIMYCNGTCVQVEFSD